jgi:hypothetical protein
LATYAEDLMNKTLERYVEYKTKDMQIGVDKFASFTEMKNGLNKTFEQECRIYIGKIHIAQTNLLPF